MIYHISRVESQSGIYGFVPSGPKWDICFIFCVLRYPILALSPRLFFIFWWTLFEILMQKVQLTWLDLTWRGRGQRACSPFWIWWPIEKQWVFMGFLLVTGRVIPNFMVSPVLVQSTFKTVDRGRCYYLVWQGVPWCYDSPGKEFAADASCDGSVDLVGVSSGFFITGWREVRFGDLVDLVYVFVGINHVASDSSVFKTWQWEFPQSLLVRVVFEIRYEFSGSALNCFNFGSQVF